MDPLHANGWNSPEHGEIAWDGDVAYSWNSHVGEWDIIVDREWYAQQGACPYCGDHHPEGEHNMDPYDEFRGDVAMELRERGYVELADYYGSIPDEVAEEDYHSVEGRVAQFADEFIEFAEGEY